MDIRPGTLQDVNRLAEIAVEAFAEEPIYSHFFPYRTFYPEDYRRYLARSYARLLCSPGQIVMVSTNDDGGGSRTICGFATFIRHGSIPPQRRSRWNPDTLGSRVYRTWLWILTSLDKNRSVDDAAIASYYSQAAAARAPLGDKEYIEFQTLAVAASHQRKGYGERLVEWCGVRAVQDGVAVYGDASATALPLYVRNGCKDVGTIELPQKEVKPPAGCAALPLQLNRLAVVVLRWECSALESLVKDHLDFDRLN